MSVFVDLQRIELRFRLWQLAKQNPGYSWLLAALEMNLPRREMSLPEYRMDELHYPLSFSAN